MGLGIKENKKGSRKNTIYINRKLVNKMNVEFTVLNRILLERISEIRNKKKFSKDPGQFDLATLAGDEE